MKRCSIGLVLGLFFLTGLVSWAEAINIDFAEVQNGVAVVSGGKANANATINWEGGAVTTANRNGGFNFGFAVVPSDCVGTLSDGLTTTEVALVNCTPTPTPTAGILKTGMTLCFNESIGSVRRVSGQPCWARRPASEGHRTELHQ
jgi:hypothetical protein